MYPRKTDHFVSLGRFAGHDIVSGSPIYFLTVHATIGNQAFSHESCNTLSYNKVKITFLNGLRKNDVEAQVELTF